MGTRVKDHHLLFFFAFMLSSAVVAQSDDCVYTVYVKTGWIIKAGTDSIISLTLYSRDGDYMEISNLETWGGLMEDGHDYFKRTNLDIFSGRGRCLKTAVCAMNLTSDGSGPHHGWYCDNVEVTSTGAQISCAQKQFSVGQWIALDAPPYELTAIRNECPYDLKNHRKDQQQQQIPSDLGHLTDM
ncbi:hypothetical protein NE237_017892 [Protea cynaroides]|uniref:PLAT domain-containing protein n=1 Tax=Protea cynaroides TaxID=273540 RepID=A0A9Q0QNH6_9MAGN|nr:hypothetical protein NE237_017892 [Protea cynaroides]